MLGVVYYQPSFYGDFYVQLSGRYGSEVTIQKTLTGHSSGLCCQPFLKIANIS